MYPVRADLLLFLLPMLLALLLGCSPEKADEVGAGSEEAREKLYEAKAKQFGELLLAQKMDEAHAMTSKRFQAQYDLLRFEDLWKAKQQEFGEFGPAKCVAGAAGEVDPKILAEEPDIAKDFPPDSLGATAFAQFVLEGECEDNIRCFEAYMLFVKEDGQDRIADLEFMWCD